MYLKVKSTARSKKLIRLVIFILLFAWCTGFSTASLFPKSDTALVLHPLLKHAYGLVCHQIPFKTFYVSGHHFLVCARCSGIYFGALIISLLSLFFLPKMNFGLKFLYSAMFPMAADVIFTSTGIYAYSKPIAFATGIFFGSVVFVYILAVLENNLLDKKLKNNES